MSTATFTFAISTATATTMTIGLIGQILSILIFSRKTFRNNSISTYCIALSTNEFLSLFRFAINISVIVYSASPADQSDALCKVFNYFPAINSAIQSGLLVAFSVDKLLSMRINPIPILKKKWFQWSIVAGIVIFNILFFLEIPILIKLREVAPGRLLCDLHTISFLPVLMILVVLETCIIPFIIMIVSSILTIRILIKSRNSVERVGSLGRDRRSRDQKYALTSVAFNIMFLVLKTPFMIYYALSAFNYYNVYYLNISIFLFYLNSASFFFIHLVTNSLFRREFLILIRLAKSNGENSSNKINRNLTLNRISPIV